MSATAGTRCLYALRGDFPQPTRRRTYGLGTLIGAAQTFAATLAATAIS